MFSLNEMCRDELRFKKFFQNLACRKIRFLFKLFSLLEYLICIVLKLTYITYMIYSIAIIIYNVIII